MNVILTKLFLFLYLVVCFTQSKTLSGYSNVYPKAIQNESVEDTSGMGIRLRTVIFTVWDGKQRWQTSRPDGKMGNGRSGLPSDDGMHFLCLKAKMKF